MFLGMLFASFFKFGSIQSRFYLLDQGIAKSQSLDAEPPNLTHLQEKMYILKPEA